VPISVIKPEEIEMKTLLLVLGALLVTTPAMARNIAKVARDERLTPIKGHILPCTHMYKSNANLVVSVTSSYIYLVCVATPNSISKPYLIWLVNHVTADADQIKSDLKAVCDEDATTEKSMAKSLEETACKGQSIENAISSVRIQPFIQPEKY